ncbi:MAG: LysR family transcriptional regulator [Bacillota bacterium]|nr:LysR family transcriptional regulator [Bacillota bacterium]
MDLKQLQYFVTVVDEGNITAAAKKLHMSQPPLSTQIKILEEELGCLLFERGARQIQLTDAGRMLYDHGVNLLELSRAAKDEIQNYADKYGGIIRIGIVSSVVSTLASKWIKGYVKENSNVKFEIYESDTYQLLEKLRKNIIHAAVVRTPFAASGFTCEFLSGDSVIAVGHKNLFSNKEITTLDELSQKPLILYRRWEQIIHKLFEDESLQIKCFCVNDDARTTVHFADEGLGISIVPASAAKLIRNPDVECRKIDKCHIDSKIELVYNPESYIPACTKYFIEYLKKMPLNKEL